MLSHWHYLPAEIKTPGPHDSLLNYVSGSFDDVEAASLDGLIDGEIYAAALEGYGKAVRDHTNRR